MSVPRICAAKNNSKSVPQDQKRSIKLILRYSSTVLQRPSGSKSFRALQYFEHVSQYSPFIFCMSSIGVGPTRPPGHPAWAGQPEGATRLYPAHARFYPVLLVMGRIGSEGLPGWVQAYPIHSQSPRTVYNAV